MFSLALMVGLIFLVVLLSGPLSLFFLNFNCYMVSGILAGIAISFGVYWLLVAPFPVSIVGVMSAALGVLTFMKM